MDYTDGFCRILPINYPRGAAAPWHTTGAWTISSNYPERGGGGEGHSTLEVTGVRTATQNYIGVFRWEIFLPRRGSFSEWGKKWSNGENKKSFGKFPLQSTNFDTFLKEEMKIWWNVAKKGVILWGIVKNWLRILIRNQFLKIPQFIKIKRRGGGGSLGESELKKGGQCVDAPPSTILGSAPG